MPAGATADASATAFVEDFFKKGRAPRPSDCVAAASASASAFSSAKGGEAFSFAKAQADASSFAPGSQGWRNKFIGACTARASASAESFASGGKGGGFAGRHTLNRRCRPAVLMCQALLWLNLAEPVSGQGGSCLLGTLLGWCAVLVRRKGLVACVPSHNAAVVRCCLQVPRLMQMPSATAALPLLMLMPLRPSVGGAALPLLTATPPRSPVGGAALPLPLLTLLHPAGVVVLHVSP